MWKLRFYYTAILIICVIQINRSTFISESVFVNKTTLNLSMFGGNSRDKPFLQWYCNILLISNDYLNSSSSLGNFLQSKYGLPKYFFLRVLTSLMTISILSNENFFWFTIFWVNVSKSPDVPPMNLKILLSNNKTFGIPLSYRLYTAWVCVRQCGI